jgi:hypothetical protein
MLVPRFPPLRLAAAESDKWRPCVSQRRKSATKMAPALYFLEKTGGPRNEDRRTDKEPKTNTQRLTLRQRL